MKKLCEYIVHYNYIYRFDPLFRKNKEIYNWIIKKYLPDSDIKNFELEIENMKKDEIKYKEFQDEIKILDNDIDLNKNTHPFRLNITKQKKIYLNVLVLFISNFYSITAKNILQLEKIARQLSVSSNDLLKYIKEAKNEIEKKSCEECAEKFFNEIGKLNFNDIEKRILKLDLLLFVYNQKEKKKKKFEKIFFEKLNVTTKEINYIVKEIIEKQEDENE